MKTTVSEDRAFIEHIIDNTILESAIDFIKDRFSAEEVYGKDVLEIWATENGFTSDKEVGDLEGEVDNLKGLISTLSDEIIRLQEQLSELNE